MVDMDKPNPRYDRIAVTARYHSLPDRSPYLYFRTPEGRRLCFPQEEIRHINLERNLDKREIILTASSGYRFRVTSIQPEVSSSSPSITVVQ